MREEQRPRRKDYIEDYADAACRFYASVGGLEKWVAATGEEKLIDAIQRRSREEIGYIQGGLSDPTFAAVSWADGDVTGDNKTLREWHDLYAVERMRTSMRLLENGRHRVRALDETLCSTTPWPHVREGQTARIEMAALVIPVGTRTIWRWIRDAQILFAKAKGLRLEQRHIDRLHRMRLEIK